MAKANLGTKRVCPETGKKFYDLEKDPVISPYTGNEYPVSFFDGPAPAAPTAAEKEADKEEKPDAIVEDEAEVEIDDDAPEIISLEDAEDDDDDNDDEEIPDIPDIPDVEIDDDDDDAAEDNTFLEEDEDDPDLSDVIVPVESSDDEG